MTVFLTTWALALALPLAFIGVWVAFAVGPRRAVPGGYFVAAVRALMACTFVALIAVFVPQYPDDGSVLEALAQSFAVGIIVSIPTVAVLSFLPPSRTRRQVEAEHDSD